MGPHTIDYYAFIFDAVNKVPKDTMIIIFKL